MRKRENSRWLFSLFGGPEEDRTLDLCIANAALSQLSYGPINATCALCTDSH